MNARWEAVKWEVVREQSGGTWESRDAEVGRAWEPGIRAGHAALRGNSGDILEKSHRAYERRPSHQGHRTRFLRRTNMAWHGMRREACVRRAHHSSPDLPVAHLNAIGHTQQ